MSEFIPFLPGDFPVFPFSDSIESQIHDPDSFQLLYLISQIPAHPADLPVQSLSQNDPKAVLSRLLYLTRSGHSIQDRDPSAHSADKFPVQRFIYKNKVFLLMIITCTHDPVDQISLICQKQQPLRFFIQPSHRIDAQRIIQIIRNRYLLPLLSGAAYDSSGFIKQQQYFFFVFTDRHMIDTDLILRRDPLTADSLAAVHCNPFLFDHPVRFASGTHTCLT